MKKVISFVVALIITLSAFTACGSSDGGKTAESGKETTAESAKEKEAEFTDELCGKSPYGYEIEQSVMAYYTYEMYNYNAALYEGLDLRSNLLYFAEVVKEQLNRKVILASKGMSEGMQLTDEELAEIDNSIDIIKSYAEIYGLTTDEYLSDQYAPGVTEATVRKCLTLDMYAQKYYDELYKSWKIRSDDLLTYRNAHPELFLKVDCMNVWFGIEQTGMTMSEDEENKAYDAAKKEAEQFAKKANNEKRFRSEAIEKCKSDGRKATESSGQKFTPASDSEYLATVTANGRMYQSNDPVSEWLFSAGRKVGDVGVIRTEGGYMVCCITALPYYDEYRLATVRQIPIATVNHESEKKTKALADKAYKEFCGSDMTEKAFIDLVIEYSDDSNCMSTGGLYSDFSKEDAAKEFSQAFADWCFEGGRKAGDSGVVKTSFGYSIIYYVSDGDKKWELEAREMFAADKLLSETEALKERFGVTYNDEVIRSMFS